MQGTAAPPFLQPDNGRMFGSLGSVASNAIAALAYVYQQRGPSFSVRKCVATQFARVVGAVQCAATCAELRGVQEGMAHRDGHWSWSKRNSRKVIVFSRSLRDIFCLPSRRSINSAVNDIGIGDRAQTSRFANRVHRARRPADVPALTATEY